MVSRIAMKLIYTTLLAGILCLGMAQAQEVLITRDARISGMGGPILEIGSINGSVGVSSGGAGALLVDNFFVGAYGLGTASYGTTTWNNENYDIRLDHGGIWIGYFSDMIKLVHLQASLKGGIGTAYLDSERDRFQFNEERDQIFSLQPEIGASVNVTHFFKITGGVGYRWISGVNLANLQNRDFSSPTFSLGFMFGWFAQK